MKESERLRAAGVSDETIRLIEQREAVEALSPTSEFVIYAEGLCGASVCSSLPQAEVERRMAAIPCGTRNGWTFAAEPFDADTPNPCPCDKNPETHTHYLFNA